MAVKRSAGRPVAGGRMEGWDWETKANQSSDWSQEPSARRRARLERRKSRRSRRRLEEGMGVGQEGRGRS
jgi:hypothetical protein